MASGARDERAVVTPSPPVTLADVEARDRPHRGVVDAPQPPGAVERRQGLAWRELAPPDRGSVVVEHEQSGRWTVAHTTWRKASRLAAGERCRYGAPMRQYMHQQRPTGPSAEKRSSSAGQRSAVSSRTTSSITSDSASMVPTLRARRRRTVSAMRTIDTGTEDLLAVVDDGVATLTMNRPERRNAMSGAMNEALARTLAEVEVADDVGCVVLTGAGGAFCAGGDVKGMASGGDAGAGPPMPYDARVHRQRLNQRAISQRLYEMPKPTIAALPGAAAGAGLSLALACDLRYATPTRC